MKNDSIAARIKEAREAAGLTQAQLAKIVGTTSQNISQYERGLRKPKIEMMKKLADALGCSASDFDESLAALVSVGDNIRYWRKNEGMTIREFSEKAGVNSETIRQYENGSMSPKKDDVKKMASALNDTPDLFYLDTESDPDRWPPERYACRDLASYIAIMKAILLKRKADPTPLTPEKERTWAYNEIPFIAEKYGVKEEWLKEAYDTHSLGGGASDPLEMVDAIPYECLQIIDIMNFMNAAGRQIAVERVSELAQLLQYQNPAWYETMDLPPVEVAGTPPGCKTTSDEE